MNDFGDQLAISLVETIIIFPFIFWVPLDGLSLNLVQTLIDAQGLNSLIHASTECQPERKELPTEIFSFCVIEHVLQPVFLP